MRFKAKTEGAIPKKKKRKNVKEQPKNWVFFFHKVALTEGVPQTSLAEMVPRVRGERETATPLKEKVFGFMKRLGWRGKVPHTNKKHTPLCMLKNKPSKNANPVCFLQTQLKAIFPILF